MARFDLTDVEWGMIQPFLPNKPRAGAGLRRVSDKTAVGGLLAAHPAPGDVVADRGYDARVILNPIAAHDGRGHVPTRHARKVQPPVDAAAYRQCNLVERVRPLSRTGGGHGPKP